MGSLGDEDSAAALSLVLVNKDGGYAHSDNVPDAVREEFAKQKHMAYLSLGTRGRYFMKKTTGWTQWNANGDEDFAEYIRDTDSVIQRVTFGADNSWFVLLGGGGYRYQGAPAGFKAAHSSNKYSKKTIEDVSWGPNGEWWVRWTDGTWKSSDDCSSECCDRIDELKRGGWDIKKIVFGPNEEWIIRCG